MGRDSEEAKKALSNSASLFKAYGFVIKNGKVVLTKEGDNKIQESGKIYTENEAQNDVFALSKELVSNLNKAMEMGLVASDETHNMNRMIRIAKREGSGFVPNHVTISSITENGQVRH
jgi:predicted HNH restriction endonuclease